MLQDGHVHIYASRDDALLATDISVVPMHHFNRLGDLGDASKGDADAEISRLSPVTRWRVLGSGISS